MRIHPILKKAVMGALGLTSLFCAGCSTIMTRPFPGQESSVTIGVTDTKTGDADWAPGSYHLPNANVCIAKGQGEEDADKAQAFFGLIGRAVAVGESAGAIQKTIQGQEDKFSLDMENMTKDCLDHEMGATKGFGRFSTGKDWKTTPLQITPYAVLSFVDEYNARLWVVLKVKWTDPNPDAKGWNCRYIVGLGDPRPLTGEGGWASSDGNLLQSTAIQDILLALQVMFDDLQGKLRNDQVPKENTPAQWMFYEDSHPVLAQLLRSAPGYDIFLPMVEDDEFFAGVNVVPKNFIFNRQTGPEQ
jgi:hypothetical protein